MTNLARKLKQDILASGLPTEIQVTKMLRRDNWMVINQYPYVDEKTGKIRTLDIQATKALQGGRACTLFIECKRATDHQWVFYAPTAETESFSLLLRLTENIAQFIDRSMAGSQQSKQTMGPFYSAHPSHAESTKLGTISYIPFRKKDDFNEARSQLLGAIESRKLIASEKRIVYPMIIFDGELYEVEIKGDDIELARSDYVTFLSSMISEVTPILIDVVTLTFFPAYLEMLSEELGPARSLEELAEEVRRRLAS